MKRCVQGQTKNSTLIKTNDVSDWTDPVATNCGVSLRLLITQRHFCEVFQLDDQIIPCKKDKVAQSDVSFLKKKRLSKDKP